MPRNLQSSSRQGPPQRPLRTRLSLSLNRLVRGIRKWFQKISPSAWVITFSVLLLSAILLYRSEVFESFPAFPWLQPEVLPGAEPPIALGEHEVAEAEYLALEVSSVQVKRSVGDPQGRGDFRLLIVLADGSGQSTATYCPGKGPLSIDVDQVFKPCGENTINLNRKDIQGDLYVYLIAFDEDKEPADAGWTLTSISTLLSYGLGRLVGPAPAVAEITLDMIASQIADETVSAFFETHDVLGSGAIRLTEESGWGVDTSPVIRDAGKKSSVEIILNVRKAYSPGGVFRLDLYSTSPIVGNTYNPADFIRSYFKLITEKEYRKAWEMYTPLFYQKQPEWSWGNFVAAWEPIKSVDVYDAKVEWWKPLTAKVTSAMTYSYVKGGVDSTDIQSFYLIWDENKQDWLIDQTVVVRTVK